MNKVDEVFKLNEKYEMHDHNGVYNKISNLKIIKGNIPIILSAPHSVRQFKNNHFKQSDGLTGGLVEFLSYDKDVFGITRIHNKLDDPNSSNISLAMNYKRAIIDLINNYDINYLFDIHGCSNKHDFAIDIGTNNYSNINDFNDIDMLIKHFSILGKVTVDNKFKATSDTNVSRYINRVTGISCFQLEISEQTRFYNTELLIDSLEGIIDEIKSKVLKKSK